MKGTYDIKKRTKRYVLLFAEWWEEEREERRNRWQGNIKKESLSWHEYDDLREVKEEIEVIKEIYKDQPFRKDRNDFVNRDYGYAVLDYEAEKIILSGFKGFKGLTVKDNKNLKVLDKYFRGPDEIPEDYKWDNGEYEGWLQFRWGDGKNAIDYKPEPKKKSDSNLMTDQELYEIYDDDWTIDEEAEIMKQFKL